MTDHTEGAGSADEMEEPDLASSEIETEWAEALAGKTIDVDFPEITAIAAKSINVDFSHIAEIQAQAAAMSRTLDAYSGAAAAVRANLAGHDSIVAQAAGISKMIDVNSAAAAAVRASLAGHDSIISQTTGLSRTFGMDPLVATGLRQKMSEVAGLTAYAEGLSKMADVEPLITAALRENIAGSASIAAFETARKLSGWAVEPPPGFTELARKLSELSRTVDVGQMLGVTRNLSKLAGETMSFTAPLGDSASFAAVVEGLMPPADFLDRLTVDIDDVDDDEFEAIAESIENDPFWKDIVDKLTDSAIFRATFSRKTARRAAVFWVWSICTTLHLVAGAIPFAGGIPAALGVPGGKSALDLGRRTFDKYVPPKEDDE